MEKIHENMCFDVVFLYENIRTCLFTYVFLYFLHLVLTFTPHYIIMVKGLLDCANFTKLIIQPKEPTGDVKFTVTAACAGIIQAFHTQILSQSR